MTEDLGINIVSKEQALWMKVKENAEIRLKSAQEGVIVETALIELAKKKIKEESRAH